MIQFVPRPMPEGVQETAEPLHLPDYPDWFQHLLRLRGVKTQAEADAFLHPSLDQLHDPLLMQGMEDAVALINQAIRQGQHMLVYGDYDCDGVCATAILVESLRGMGAHVNFYLPNRHRDGYGLNTKAIDQFALTHQLLITVDCGITNVGEVRHAKKQGMKVIVTDHHQLGAELPKADAVLNPLLGDYPFRRLCGAGVALKLCQALRGTDGVMAVIDLAAIATVADLVPLLGENRVMVAEGLKRMHASPRPCLRALAETLHWKGDCTAMRIAFQIAPRLNAAGRLQDARQAVELLLASDMETARPAAQALDEINFRRKEQEQVVLTAARELVKDADAQADRCILVMGEGWETGVIGLAAGRLCERHYLPTLVLSKNGNTAVGSCRSIPGINIHRLLTSCSDLFQRFGGHEMTAGLTMDADQVEELHRRLKELLATADFAQPAHFRRQLEYDMAVSLPDLTFEAVDALAALEPTGLDNPAPQLLLRGVAPVLPRAVGGDGTHLKLALQQGDSVLDAIAFSKGDQAQKLPSLFSCICTPAVNHFNGHAAVQVQIQALNPQDTWVLPILQEIDWLVSNKNQFPFADHQEGKSPREAPLLAKPADLARWVKGKTPTLFIAHHPDTAAAFQRQHPAVPVATGAPGEPHGHTLLVDMDLAQLQGKWKRVVLLEGDLLPGEAAAICHNLPQAEIRAMPLNDALRDALHQLYLPREAMLQLYMAIKAQAPTSMAAWCQLAMRPAHVLYTALYTFQQMKLLTFAPYPLTLTLLEKPPRQEIDDLPLRQYLQACFPAEG